jgi:hypothetical protein
MSCHCPYCIMEIMAIMSIMAIILQIDSSAFKYFLQIKKKIDLKVWA